MSIFVKVQTPSMNPNKKHRMGKFDKDGASIELEKALRKFKKKVKDSKILKDYHERMYFVKTSEKKRAKRMMAKYRAQQQNLLTKN